MTAGHLRENFRFVEPGHTLLLYQNLVTKKFGFFGEDTFITIKGKKVPISKVHPQHGEDYSQIPDFPIPPEELSQYSFLFMTHRHDQGTILIDSVPYFRPEIIVVTQVNTNHSDSFANTMLFPSNQKGSAIRLVLTRPSDGEKLLDSHYSLKSYLKHFLNPTF